MPVPVAYEPPTIATCALPFVHEDEPEDRRSGGNVPPLATRETTPLTESETVGGGGCGGRRRRARRVGCVDGTALAPGGVVAVVVVVVVVGGTSAPGLFADVGVVLVAAPVSDGACAVDTCGVNGFFVSKTLNDTSWPAPEAGGTSVSTSSPLEWSRR